MRAAIYARVSSDKQDIDLSISAQLKALREYAGRNNYEVIREFVDEAESGRTASRPAFKEMLALAKLKQPPFEAILVWKLNRFARSRADSVTYKTLLRNKGIEVISINEPIDDSPVGRLIEGVIECIDEFYSANLGQDIKRGMREKASRGFFNCSRPPYGYKTIKIRDGDKLRNKLELEPEESAAVKAVKAIFEMAYSGMGCKEIAKELNKECLRTAKGERWGRVTVHKILTNEAYCGTLIWGGKKGHPAARRGELPIRVDNAWPALVSRETFDTIQKNMSERRPAKIHPRTVPSLYLLSGILFCSCGSAMIGHSAKSGRHFYYLCSRNYKQGKEACNSKMIRKEYLEKTVIDQIKQKVLTDDNLEELVKIVNEEIDVASQNLRERLANIEYESSDVRNRLTRLYDALETGKLDHDDLAPRIKELRSRQDELSKAKILTEAEMTAQGVKDLDIENVKSDIFDLRQLLEETEVAERKSFLRSFVKKIVIENERATIYYILPGLQGAPNGEEKEVLPIVTSGGAEGIRTPDLLRAREALSQLSYSPMSCDSLY
jgi:site-specific DNA recombinase